MLKRLEGDQGFRDAEGHLIGPTFVRQFVSCLAANRHGLSQRELVELLAPVETSNLQGNVPVLQRLLRPCAGG
jgi:hypothetical protein